MYPEPKYTIKIVDGHHILNMQPDEKVEFFFSRDSVNFELLEFMEIGSVLP